MEDVLTNEPHSARPRTPLKQKMSSMVEKHTVFNPKPDKVGRINASGSKPLVFDVELQSAKGSNSKNVGRIFFSDPELIRDRIFAIQSPAGKGPETSAPVFPPFPLRLIRGERGYFLSQFTRAVRGDVILNRKTIRLESTCSRVAKH